MSDPDLLIIEDEVALARALATVGARVGAVPKTCASGTAGLQELAKGKFRLVVLDIGLPDMNGLAVLEKMNRLKPRPPALIITAHGTLQNAVSARKLGAVGYLVKPLDLHDLEKRMRDLLAQPAESSPRHHLAAAVEETGSLLGGAGSEMQRVFIGIAHAANSDAPAILTGPTGTGKTLAAQVIHSNSQRRSGPFVTLLCGAIPQDLLESELFGHEKNAFTGAASMRPGHLERAAGGTLLLDEVADIPLATQAKLLRFVEEKTFNRVGGRHDIRVDARLIAATNKSLREEVQAGRFREDLYYRLHVLEIELPPLAKRREDIPALAAYFLSKFAAGRELSFNADSNRLLLNYPWPGNVRELRNAIEHAVAVCAGASIQPQHFPAALLQPALNSNSIDLDTTLRQWVAAKVQEGATYKELYSEVETTLLKNLLQQFGQKPTILARVLKMNRATLLKKRRAFGLRT